MLLDGKIDDDSDAGSPDIPSRAWAIRAGICCLPLYVLFSALGNAGRGTAASCFGLTIVIVVRLRWELRNRAWFWVVVGLLVLLHLAMVILIPWPNQNYTLPIVLPVGIVDLLAISWLIQLAARTMGSTESNGDDSPTKN